jgi:uncharacterized protein (DUF2235 family)
MSDEKIYVVLFDGTGNTYGDCKTNVALLHDMIARPEGKDVKRYYIKGVGARTDEAFDGNLWGAGMDERLQEAYRWLSKLHTTEPDKLFDLYVFGFSRGAYLARTFCWLLNNHPLPMDANDCAAIYAEFKGKAALDLHQIQSANTQVKMLGLWDTVKSTPIYPDTYDAALAPNVKLAYHAMAIDELRANFSVMRLDDPRAEEVWFAGVHSDVGGGYQNSQGLSNITLEWMVDHAVDCGLPLKDTPIDPDPLALMHDEYNTLKWEYLGKSERIVRATDPLHVSVQQRLQSAIASYIPRTSAFPAEPLYVLA